MPLSYVLLNVELGSDEKVLDEVRKVPNVKECHRLYGVYDMIAKVEADSMDKLKEIITWKIRRLDRCTFHPYNDRYGIKHAGLLVPGRRCKRDCYNYGQQDDYLPNNYTGNASKAVCEYFTRNVSECVHYAEWA